MTQNNLWAQRSACHPETAAWLYLGPERIGTFFLCEDPAKGTAVPDWCFSLCPSGDLSPDVWVYDDGPPYQPIEQAIPRIIACLPRDLQFQGEHGVALSSAIAGVDPASVPVLPPAASPQ